MHVQPKNEVESRDCKRSILGEAENGPSVSASGRKPAPTLYFVPLLPYMYLDTCSSPVRPYLRPQNTHISAIHKIIYVNVDKASLDSRQDWIM